MCQSNLDPADEVTRSLDTSVRCVLGDFSSAWDKFTDENLYTGGPSRAEQTDEYAPPESFFDTESPWLFSPAFDSWSIGIVALELLLGTPNVFTVDQRTKAILTHKLKHRGASDEEIERALYLYVFPCELQMWFWYEGILTVPFSERLYPNFAFTTLST